MFPNGKKFKKVYIHNQRPFGATLVTLTNQLISADFNQLIFYFLSDLGIFNQTYNMGHFSHSILVTEPDSVIRITKFQKFWIFWNLWNLSVKNQIMGIFNQN